MNFMVFLRVDNSCPTPLVVWRGQVSTTLEIIVLKLGRKRLGQRRSLVVAAVSHPRCRPEWPQPVCCGRACGGALGRLRKCANVRFLRRM